MPVISALSGQAFSANPWITSGVSRWVHKISTALRITQIYMYIYMCICITHISISLTRRPS